MLVQTYEGKTIMEWALLAKQCQTNHQAALDEVLKEAVKFAVACLESRELRDSAHWFLNYDKRVNEYRTRQGKKEG